MIVKNVLIVPSLHGMTCIHQDMYSFSRGYSILCGKPVRKNQPHGWLCVEHDLMLRGISLIKAIEVTDGN